MGKSFFNMEVRATVDSFLELSPTPKLSLDSFALFTLFPIIFDAFLWCWRSAGATGNIHVLPCAWFIQFSTSECIISLVSCVPPMPPISVLPMPPMASLGVVVSFSRLPDVLVTECWFFAVVLTQTSPFLSNSQYAPSTIVFSPSFPLFLFFFQRSGRLYVLLVNTTISGLFYGYFGGVYMKTPWARKRNLWGVPGKKLWAYFWISVACTST